MPLSTSQFYKAYDHGYYYVAKPIEIFRYLIYLCTYVDHNESSDPLFVTCGESFHCTISCDVVQCCLDDKFKEMEFSASHIIFHITGPECFKANDVVPKFIIL